MAKIYVASRHDKFTRAIVRKRSATGGGLKSTFTQSQSKHNVRRPLHGMTLPEDSYASMTIITPSGTSKSSLYNTSSDGDSLKSSYTTNFIVQSVVESKAERQQVVQTFGDDYVYFYGQQPVTLQVQAILPESEEFQYAQEFWLNYGSALRGTQLVLKDARMYLTVAGQVFEGYLTTASTTKSADSPRLINLNFSVYVTNSYYVRALTKSMPYKTDDKYTSVRSGDFIRLKGEGLEISDELDSNRDIPTSIAKIARSVGFGSYVNDIRELNGATGSGTRSSAIEAKSSMDVNRSTYSKITEEIIGAFAGSVELDPEPLVVPLKSSKGDDESLSFSEFAATTLKVAAGGIFVAGVVKGIEDDYRSYIAGGGKNGIGGYAYNRIKAPVLDATDAIVDSALDSATRLRTLGYQVVRPNISPDNPGIEIRSSRSSDTESVDALVLDI